MGFFEIENLMFGIGGLIKGCAELFKIIIGNWYEF